MGCRMIEHRPRHVETTEDVERDILRLIGLFEERFGPWDLALEAYEKFEERVEADLRSITSQPPPAGGE